MSAKKRVLLVDDDADFVDMNRAVLENHGYEVAVAYDGRQCLELTGQARPDLIILDVMMTRTSEGFDVSRELRNREHTKDIPLLMVTSINETVPFKYGPDETWLPVDSFLEKPIDPTVLLAEVNRQLKA